MNNPFVEKYRPTIFSEIILSETNRTIFQNILETGIFPNLFFYGPPGTGKTTTIVNLIDDYQTRYCNTKYINKKSSIIHLNASDDRGIEIIRTQINNFINTKTLVNDEMKFVILDEVDYMTKNAQQALKYMLEHIKTNKVVFCLICNYISKIDNNLQNEFIKLRFNEMPKEDIIKKLQYICDEEKLEISKIDLEKIQGQYKSDMRSMINFIQLYVRTEDIIVRREIHVATKEYINDFLEMDEFNINCICDDLKIERYDFIKMVLHNIIGSRLDKITPKFVKFMEEIVQNSATLINEDEDFATSVIKIIKKELKS